MFKFFFDQDGIVWHYDSDKDITTCTLGDFHIVEDDYIFFITNYSEVIGKFSLHDYELFDKII